MKTRLWTCLSAGMILAATPALAQDFMAGGVGAEQELGAFGLGNFGADFGAFDASSDSLDMALNDFYGTEAVESSTQSKSVSTYSEDSGNTHTGAYDKKSGQKVQEEDHIYKALVNLGDVSGEARAHKASVKGMNVSAEATALGAFLAKRGIKADAVIVQRDPVKKDKEGHAVAPRREHITVYRHVVKHKPATHHVEAHHPAPAHEERR